MWSLFFPPFMFRQPRVETPPANLVALRRATRGGLANKHDRLLQRKKNIDVSGDCDFLWGELLGRCFRCHRRNASFSVGHRYWAWWLECIDGDINHFAKCTSACRSYRGGFLPGALEGVLSGLYFAFVDVVEDV